MDKAELVTVFKVATYLCSFLTVQNEYQQEANKLVKVLTKQVHRPVDLVILAIFKYLLPEDIAFEYQETPFYAEIGGEPREILVFEFKDKRPPGNPLKHIPKLIAKRVAKFDAALSQYLSRRTLEELPGLAESYLPKLSDVDGSSDRSIEVGSVSHAEIVSQLKETAEAVRCVPAREASFAEAPPEFQPLLQRWGVDKLYSHQREGIDALLDGHNIVVTTATASGKSLIYQLALSRSIQVDPEATFLFIYPTKALAQDQCQKLAKYIDCMVGTFDGDTTFDQRESLRERGKVFLSNPDILHRTILPHWGHWRRILENLKYVVIDELHYYSGAFGSHVSMVLRRLRRLCFQLGNDSIQFIACSATVQLPIKLMSNMTGIPEDCIRTISTDGSPVGAKEYILKTTPNIVPGDPGSGRVHPIALAAPMFIKLISSGQRVISFCQTRGVCEQLMRAVRKALEGTDEEPLINTIMSYRGGYTPADRRRIESDMFQGKLRGIIATCALEVGIDIGNLDAAIIVGFPRSLSSFRQQVGRVGRRNRDSIVVYLASGSVMDTTYIAEPDKLLADPDPVIPLAFHDSIVGAHLRCASFELALDEDDKKFFPGNWTDLVHSLDNNNGLYHCPARWLPDPAKSIDIRSVEQEETVVIDITNNRNVVLETVEFSRIGFTTYEGGIYIHQGKSYIVVELDADLKFAKVKRTSVSWITRQRDYTDIDPIKSSEDRLLGPLGCKCSRGKVGLKTVVFGYFKVDAKNRILEAVDLDLPPVKRLLSGTWINLPSSILDTLVAKQLHPAGAIHAAEHALLSLMPLFVSTAEEDLGTECKAPEKEFAKRQTSRLRPARLIFYEKSGAEAGNGVLREVFDQFPKILNQAVNLVDACRCKNGCSNCVASARCREHSTVLSKPGAQVILRMLAGASLEGIPDGPEPNLGVISIETVVPVPAYHPPRPTPLSPKHE